MSDDMGSLYEDLQRECIELRADLDAARAERDHALKAAPAEHARHLVTMAERDALAAKLAEVTQERDEARMLAMKHVLRFPDAGRDALAARLARAEAALEWYAEKAQAVARHMQATPPKPEACLAILTEMSLDGGRRRDAYFADKEPRT